MGLSVLDWGQAGAEGAHVHIGWGRCSSLCYEESVALISRGPASLQAWTAVNELGAAPLHPPLSCLCTLSWCLSTNTSVKSAPLNPAYVSIISFPRSRLLFSKQVPSIVLQASFLKAPSTAFDIALHRQSSYAAWVCNSSSRGTFRLCPATCAYVK